jgi:hypothetical protein
MLRRLGMQGKKRRKKTIRLKGIDSKGQSFSEDRNIWETGLLAVFPTSSEPPRMVTGVPQANDVIISVIPLADLRYIGPFRSPGSYMNFKPLLFAKMLAKIAHAEAIASIGTDTFMPALPEFIIGKDDNWPDWVGECPYKDLPRICIDQIVSVQIYILQPPYDNILLGRVDGFDQDESADECEE